MMDVPLMLNFYEQSNTEGVKPSISWVVYIQKLLCRLCCSRTNDETLINIAAHKCNPNSMKNIVAPPVKQIVCCFSCCSLSWLS